MRRVIAGAGIAVVTVALAGSVALAGDSAPAAQFLSLTAGPPAALAQDEDDGEHDAPQHMIDRVHESTGLPKDQILALRTQHGLGWGEIRHVASINVAIGNQVSVEELAQGKTAERGWGEIARELGLHPSVLGRGGKPGLSAAGVGGPPGHAKGRIGGQGKTGQPEQGK